MHPTLCRFALFLAAFLGPLPAIAQPTPAAPAPAPAQAQAKSPTTLDIHINPLLELHFLLRSVVYGKQEAPKLDGIDAAVATVRQIDNELKSPLAWGLFDATIAESPDSAAVRKAFEALPESRKLFSGEEFALRARALALADALISLEPQFMAQLWPERLKTIEAAKARLFTGVLAHQRACYDYIFLSFAMNDPGLTVPVYLMTTVPPFGGVTHRRTNNQPGGVCMVGVNDNAGTLLDETVLHESLHALDVAGGQEHALARIEKGLTDAGLSPRSRAIRDVPHTLMFVQAAATVRKCVDPNHTPYGDASGYYALVPQAYEAIKVPWQEWLDRKITMDEAIKRIVESGAKIQDLVR